MILKNKVAFLFSKENDWISSFIENEDLSLVWPGTVDYFYNKDLISNYEVVFVLGYTKILDTSFLSQNKLTLVIHESALPIGKGFSPIQWQILDNAKSVMVTLLECAAGVDSGDIILQEQLIFDGTELYEEIRFEQAKSTLSLVKKFLKNYPNFTRKKQIGTGSIFPKRGLEDSRLSVDKTIKEQFNLLRIGNNDEWPSFFEYRGSKYILKIFKVKR